VVAWALADPKLGNREVAEAMLENTSPWPDLLIVADKGYAGSVFEDFVRELGATLVRPDRRHEYQRYGKLGWILRSAIPKDEQRRKAEVKWVTEIQRLLGCRIRAECRPPGRIAGRQSPRAKIEGRGAECIAG
jgi:hypothetical protein